MEENLSAPDPIEDGWRFPGWLTFLIAVGVIAIIVLAFFVPPAAPEPIAPAALSVADRVGRTVLAIESALEAYAASHGGRFPVGKSSTEVFQKLLDGGFVKDPRLFYLEARGKVVAASAVLLPENVAYDVTVPLDLTSTGIPAVIGTGYRIEYKPGGNAVPVPGGSRPDLCADHVLVAYVGSRFSYQPLTNAGGAILAQVISFDVEIGPGRLTQLTPDGPLAPQ